MKSKNRETIRAKAPKIFPKKNIHVLSATIYFQNPKQPS